MTRTTLGRIASTTDPLLAELVEQLTDRLAAGDESAVESILANHPDHAERLQKLLPTLRVLAAVGQASDVVGTGAPAPRVGVPSSSNRASIEDDGTPTHAVGAPVPATLGDFRLLRQIGRGGMGVVYEAEQFSLRRRVALKMLPLAGMLDERALTRFRNEAQAAAGLAHPNIVPIYAVGCERGVHYYAMQYIDGLPLDRVIAGLRNVGRASGLPPESGTEGKSEGEIEEPNHSVAPSLSPSVSPSLRPNSPAETAVLAALSTERERSPAAFFRRVTELGIQAAEALHHAHELGIIHRDIKPGNLLLDSSGKLWITDFGLARIEGADNLTLTGDLLGTLRYMSPEQASGEKLGIDHRTDIYSLGATLYELAALAPAIDGQGREHLLRQVSEVEPRPPREHCASVPGDLQTILLKSLSKDPADRYPAASELADDLRRFAAQQPIRARRPTLWRRAAGWSRRHSSVVLAACGGLLVAAATAAIAAGLLWQERNRALAKANEAEQARRRSELLLRKAMDGVGIPLGVLRRPEWAEHPVAKQIAAEQSEQAIFFLETFVRDHRTDPDLQLQAGIALVSLGTMLNQMGNHERGGDSLARAAETFAGLTERYPGSVVYRLELAQAHVIRGQDLFDTGNSAAAAGQFRTAAENFRQAGRLTGNSTRVHQLTAWFHLMCPLPEFRDPHLALQNARACVKLDPNSGMHWNTLGIACYRNARYTEALAALERSLKLHEGGDSLDWFFLAMTHWRLRRHAEARQWYRQALEWRMEKNRTSDFELRLFRDEAVALMGESAN